MPELAYFEVHPQEIEGPHMIPLYHKTEGVLNVMSDDQTAIRDAMSRGFTRSYQYQEFPKTMHHPSGETKVVQNKLEQAKLSAPWQEQPFKKRSWDTRQPEPGFQIHEHHLAFLQANGYEFMNVAEAKNFFNGLSYEGQVEFLADASAWAPPEEKKRGPGRPPKDAA